MKSAVWEVGESDLKLLTQLPVEEVGNDVRQTWFHPNDASKALTIVDNQYVVWDMQGSTARVCFLWLFSR